MKTINYKIIGILFLLLSTASLFSQNKSEYFYYYKGGKMYLELNTNYMFVSAVNENNISDTELKKHIVDFKSNSLPKEDKTSQTLNKPENFIQKNRIRYWKKIELKKGNISKEDYLKQIEILKRVVAQIC